MDPERPFGRATNLARPRGVYGHYYCENSFILTSYWNKLSNNNMSKIDLSIIVNLADKNNLIK